MTRAARYVSEGQQTIKPSARMNIIQNEEIIIIKEIYI